MMYERNDQMSTSHKFKVRDEVNKHFYPVWKTKKPYNVLIGGRGSFKSSVIAMLLVLFMLAYIKRDEKANIVIIRKTANTLRDSVFQDIQWALDKFGVLGEFKKTVAPFTLKHIETGSTFYFYGHNDYQRLKSNRVGNLIGLWYEEAAEFATYEEFDQTNATFIRQKHDKASQVYTFWSANPPRNPYSWFNEWVDSLRGEDEYLIHTSTYLNDELGLLSQQMLDEIDRIKRYDYDYYRYVYLGEAVGLGTNVYNMNTIQVVDELPEDDPIIDIAYSADVGHQTSATSVGTYAITAKGNVYRLNGYYYEPKNKSRKKAPSELSKEVFEFIQSNGYNVFKYTIDSAEGGFRNQYYLDNGIRWHGVGKKEKYIMIDYTHDLLAQGRFFVLNNESNKVFIEQMRKYQWDEKTLHSDKPQPIKEDDHTVDEFQYFVTDNLRRLNLKH